MAATGRAEFERSKAQERGTESLRKSGCTVARMDTNTARCLQPAISVTALTDAELLAGTRRLVGRSNQLLAELLAHLGEVEARGIHRTRACSSLYVYCIYELRLSEDEAYRRVTAARLVRRFPALFDAVASGELHLTGLLMLGPHLDDGNLAEVLARAKHRTKREVARLVRILDPLPAVPARIEPLGPTSSPSRGVLANPTWEVFVHSLCPVRDLPSGERPRDWVENSNGGDDIASVSAPARNGATPTATLAPENLPVSTAARNGNGATSPDSLGPERYKVQFTANEEYVKLVEEAKALLSHAAPRATLEEIHLRAMRALVAALNKRKYATKEEAVEETSAPPAAAAEPVAARAAEPVAARAAEPALVRQSDVVPALPHQRGRYIPAGVRRAVLARDGGRCTYVDASGKRCCATHRLEFHHLEPFAKGGEHETANVTLRCASHNALAADEDFGREFMQEQRLPSSHEPFGEGSPSG